MAQPYLHASTLILAASMTSRVNILVLSKEPSRLSSTKRKKPSHSLQQYDVVPSSASDHYSDQSDDPRPVPWSDLDLSFDLAIVTLTYKILSGYISETVRCRKLILSRDIG